MSSKQPAQASGLHSSPAGSRELKGARSARPRSLHSGASSTSRASPFLQERRWWDSWVLGLLSAVNGARRGQRAEGRSRANLPRPILNTPQQAWASKHLQVLKKSLTPCTRKGPQQPPALNADILKWWLPTEVYIYFVRKEANFYCFLHSSFLLMMFPFISYPRRNNNLVLKI